MGAQEYVLGHLEASLRARRKGLEALRRYGREELSAAAVRSMPREYEAMIDELTGDYAGALALDTGLRLVGTDNRTADSQNAMDHARLHDFAPALAYFAQPHRSASVTVPISDAANHADVLLRKADAAGALAALKAIGPLVQNAKAAMHGFWSDRILHIALVDPLIAYAYAQQGDWAKSDAIAATLPLDSDICAEVLAKIAALRHDDRRAARLFAMVAAREPDIPFADTDWGEMLLRRGDFDGAVAKFDAAHGIGPHFADPLEFWGEALIAKNRSDLALAKFEEAGRYAPKWGRLHLKWGEALYWLGRKDEARKQFVIAAGLDLAPAEKSRLARLRAAHV